MAFSEADRVQIRHFIGASAIFVQSWPILESAITNVQSSADGGTRPDNSTETAIKGWIAQAQAVETRLAALWPAAIATGKQDDATIDPFRAKVHLCSEGRRLSGYIARMLGMTGVVADVWTSPPVVANAFGGQDLP